MQFTAKFVTFNTGGKKKSYFAPDVPVIFAAWSINLIGILGGAGGGGGAQMDRLKPWMRCQGFGLVVLWLFTKSLTRMFETNPHIFLVTDTNEYFDETEQTHSRWIAS